MNYNALSPFTNANSQQLLDAAGVTQFTSETNFYHTLSGLLIQGGFVTTAATSTTVTFNAAFPKQVLNVILQPVNSSPSNFYVSSVTLQEFTIAHGGGGSHNYYWFAIGV